MTDCCEHCPKKKAKASPLVKRTVIVLDVTTTGVTKTTTITNRYGTGRGL
jgi:orotate phosphoribosyltransferase-like protein